MRYKEILESTLRSRKRSILAFAADPEQTVFVPLEPSETGLRRTIWVSENNKFPYLIAAKEVGGGSDLTTKNTIVISLDETTLFDDVNEWLEKNRKILFMLANQTIDFVDFFEKMERPIAILREMVSVPIRKSNLPRPVWCSPNTSSHDIRIKVPTNQGDVSIALRPTVEYPPSETKRLPTKEFNKIAEWMRLNQQVIEDYWFKKITTEEFFVRMKPLP